MTLQELGSLGEFLGFFAILITLFYLARQTRLSVQISKGSEQRVLINQGNDYFRMMIEPDNLAALRLAIHSYRDLDTDSQVRVTAIMMHWINLYEQGMYAHEAGLLPKPVLMAFQNFCLGLLVTPGGREYWNEMGQMHGQDVKDRINEILDSDNHPPPITEILPWLAK